MISAEFRDKDENVLKVEQFRTEAQVYSFIKMLESEADMRTMIPNLTEFIKTPDKTYWIDRRETKWIIEER
jgi:hypothetical protein